MEAYGAKPLLPHSLPQPLKKTPTCQVHGLKQRNSVPPARACERFNASPQSKHGRGTKQQNNNNNRARFQSENLKPGGAATVPANGLNMKKDALLRGECVYIPLNKLMSPSALGTHFKNIQAYDVQARRSISCVGRCQDKPDARQFLLQKGRGGGRTTAGWIQ